MELDEILELYESGHSCLSISKMCALSMDTIRRRVVKYGHIRSISGAARLSHINGLRKPYSGGKKRKPLSTESRNKMSLTQLALNRGKGFRVTSNGYIEVTKGVNAGKGYHRVLMEEFLGRELSSCEVVHHIDRNRKNNNMSNLQLMTRMEHSSHHALENEALKVRSKDGRFA